MKDEKPIEFTVKIYSLLTTSLSSVIFILTVFFFSGASKTFTISLLFYRNI